MLRLEIEREMTVLLAGPGVVWELAFGCWVLLPPERIYARAQAVIRTLQADEDQHGCIREDELLAGDLVCRDFKRLPREDETGVLRTLLEKFISRPWCLRQPCDGMAMLTLPSHLRRERKKQPTIKCF